MHLRRLLRKNGGFGFWCGRARFFRVGKRGYETTAHDWNRRLAGITLRLHSRRSDQRALVATVGSGTTGALFPGSNVPRDVAAATHASTFVQSRDRTAAGTSVVAILCAPAQSPRAA